MDQLAKEIALKRNLRRVGAIAVLLAIATTGLGIGVRVHEGAEVRHWTDDQAVPNVSLIAAKKAAADRELVLPGTVRAFIDAPIHARVGGYLKRWFVDIGTTVKEGQALAEIETPELDQQLLQAEADLATARANEKLSATTTARWQHMLSADAVSKQEADEKEGDYAAKTAIVHAAEANVARLRATAAFKTIVAPFSGVVTARKTDVGALINAGAGSGQELFRIADARKVRIYVDIPQPFTSFITKGVRAHLKLPERPGESLTATVADTSRAISENSRTMLVQLEADNANNLLLPGSYVDVNFQLPERTGTLRLPVSSLIFRQNGLEVATLEANGKVQLKRVTLGRDFGTEVEVTAGLTAEDKVIDSPPDSLSNGDSVRVSASTSKETGG
jgi:RND family efflux transporter MFP subunit